MCGLPCRKVIIDQGNEALQVAETSVAGLRRAIECMKATVLLTDTGKGLTEDRETEMVDAAARFKEKVKEACNELAEVCGELEAESRAAWAEDGEE